MTPQARRAPALPVVLEVLPWVPISEESPLPRSSSSSWMTHARPMMELVPSRGICKQYTRQSNCPYGNEKKRTAIDEIVETALLELERLVIRVFDPRVHRRIVHELVQLCAGLGFRDAVVF